MTYLDPNNSASDNFALITNGVWTTEEAIQKNSSFEQENLLTEKISKDVVKITAFVALSILLHCAWYTGSLHTLTYIISQAVCVTAVVYETIKLNKTDKDRDYLQKELDKVRGTVNTIYENIINFINEKQCEKAAFIKERINQISQGMRYSNRNFPANFSSIASDYDQNNQLDFSNAINSIRKENGIVLSVSKEVWERFKNACNEYATCKPAYKSLARQHKITVRSTLK